MEKINKKTSHNFTQNIAQFKKKKVAGPSTGPSKAILCIFIWKKLIKKHRTI